MIDEIQSYTFATKGMIIIRDFYPISIVERMSKSIDTTKKQSLFFENDPEIFMDFMSDSRIIEICKKFIGLWFRFDHELAVSQDEESKPYLHGGQFGSQGTCTHHPVDKYSWNGQLTVGLSISGQNPYMGGFAYIPGSHHTNIGGQYSGQLDIWKDMLDNEDIVECPTLNPGDLYVFSEAIAHGQKQWSYYKPRTTLYLKYVPGYMAWQDYEFTKKYLQFATKPIHCALLTRPYVRNGGYDSKDFRPGLSKFV